MTANEEVRIGNRETQEVLGPCCHANVLDDAERGLKSQFIWLSRNRIVPIENAFYRFPRAVQLFKSASPFYFQSQSRKKHILFSFSLSRNPNYKYCWVTLSLFEEGNAIPLLVECRRFMKKKGVEKWIITALDLIFSSFYNVLPCLTCLLYKHLYSWLRAALWTPRCIINVKVEGIMLQTLLPLLWIAFLKPI